MRNLHYTSISLYKNIRCELEQAIEDGLLICTKVRNANVIFKRTFTTFLDQHSDQYRRFHILEINAPYVLMKFLNISKDIHDQLISEKKQQLIEFQNQQLMPLNGNNAQAMIKINELKSIAQMAIDELPSEKSSLSIKLKTAK